MLHRPNFNIGFLTFFNSTGTVCIDRQPSSAMSQLEDGLSFIWAQAALVCLNMFECPDRLKRIFGVENVASCDQHLSARV